MVVLIFVLSSCLVFSLLFWIYLASYSESLSFSFFAFLFPCYSISIFVYRALLSGWHVKIIVFTRFTSFLCWCISYWNRKLGRNILKGNLLAKFNQQVFVYVTAISHGISGRGILILATIWLDQKNRYAHKCNVTDTNKLHLGFWCVSTGIEKYVSNGT